MKGSRLHREKLRACWKERLNNWKQSGINGHRYCKNKQLSYSQFTYWKSALIDSQEEIKTNSFQEHFVHLKEQPESLLDRKNQAGITLKWGNIEVQLDSNFNKEALKELIIILSQKLPC